MLFLPSTGPVLLHSLFPSHTVLPRIHVAVGLAVSGVVLLTTVDCQWRQSGMRPAVSASQAALRPCLLRAAPCDCWAAAVKCTAEVGGAGLQPGATAM